MTKFEWDNLNAEQRQQLHNFDRAMYRRDKKFKENNVVVSRIRGPLGAADSDRTLSWMAYQALLRLHGKRVVTYDYHNEDGWAG